MGISLQEYRIRIGTFGQKDNKGLTRIRQSSSSTKSKHTNIQCRMYLLLLLCLTTLTLTVQNDSDYDKTQYSSTNLDAQVNFYKNLELAEFTPLLEDCSNFYARYTYGNRRQRGFKIGSWNKGGGFLQNKIHEIENVVSGFHPHILGITEANYFKHHDENMIRIEDYDIITATTLDNPNLAVSRVVVYKHKSIVSKTRYDLMNDNIRSIWMEVGFPNKKKFLVCNVYREWQYLNQATDSSRSIQAQLDRWIIFLDQWERALATGKEVHVLGDINLNHLNWTKPNLSPNDQTYRLKPLINALFTTILPHGVTQCVKVATRVWPGVDNSGLDHYYTNKPEKLSDIQVHHQASSDHMLIFGVRYTKNIVRNIRYVKKRSYKSFNPTEFINEVRSISWWDLYQTTTVDSAVNILTTKLTQILDKLAPIKTIQIRTNYSPWL